MPAQPLSDVADIRPVPDPTVLTTQQLTGAVASLKELISTRLDAYDLAIALQQETANRSPSVNEVFLQHEERISGAIGLLNEKIASLSNVTAQQFKSIDDRFAEKDKAVSVGLQAQKESAAAQQASNTEATTKMESNFTKLLDQGRELLTEVRKNTDVQIADIKSRLDKGEGKTSVADPAMTFTLAELTAEVRTLKQAQSRGEGRGEGTNAIWGYVFGMAGLLIAAAAVVVAVVVAVRH
jgi:hypothetical protein